MRSRVGSVVVCAVLVGMLGALAPAAPAAAKTGSPAPRTHSVPPPAPSPTDSGNSPAAPDPHPPRGGRGPYGEAVGGARLLSRTLVLPAGAPAPPADLTARAWVLADLDTGDILAARDPHGRYQAASIQKLLTTITLLPRLPGSRTVTVTGTAANTEGSHAGLVGGGRYTIDQLFEGLLLVSGNDAAEALAEAAGGRARTVALMNRTALGLGAYDTYVQTPSGLDGWQQLTSAYDMMLFLKAAIAQPRFVHYDTVLQASLPPQRAQHMKRVRLYNQNVQFLTTVQGAEVAKTGYTDAAQHTFAGVIERNGHHYGVILLRAQRYPDDQWVQATKLVKWGLSLPAGTAPVGHLDAAARPAGGDKSATAARRSPSTVAAGRSGHGGSHAGWWIALAVLAGLLIAGGGVLALRRRPVRPSP